MIAPPAAAQEIFATADVDLTAICDSNGCDLRADGDHSGSVLVTGELTLEGPGLPDGGLKAVCQGTTSCDTDIEAEAVTGCFTATATTESAAGGYAQDVERGGDCEETLQRISDEMQSAQGTADQLLPLP